LEKLKAWWLPTVLAILISGQVATAWLLWEIRRDIGEVASEQDYGQPGWVDDILRAVSDAEDAASDAERAAMDASQKAQAACEQAGGNYIRC